MTVIQEEEHDDENDDDGQVFAGKAEDEVSEVAEQPQDELKE